MSEQRYTIKQLEWEDWHNSSTAETATGTYCVLKYSGGYVWDCPSGIERRVPTLEAAKLEAEQNYRERVETLLERVQ